MDAQLELHAAATVVDLVDGRVTLGKVGTDVTLDDRTVSRLHAAVERVNGGWIVSDLGSTNGTFVNGDRVRSPRSLRDGDELRLGSTRLVFRTSAGGSEPPSGTAPLSEAPTLTRRERDLLVALCQPLLEGGMLGEPASVRELAATLVVSESAVKKLLGRTYDRFGLEGDGRRRGKLALEALGRGAVSLADLRPG